MDCIFCKIIARELPATICYEENGILAIDDLHPKAPIHKLIIPEKHIATLDDADANDTALLGSMLQTAKLLARQLNIAEPGYRLVMNCNAGGGQVIFHIHLHLLGGRPFQP